MKRSRLIVFEGPDGAGKTTLCKAIAKALRERGHDCLQISFPGIEDGTLGRHIYDLHHAPKRFAVESLSPLALQTLHVAAHVEAIKTRIRPAFTRGTTILLDRFWWSTWVYGLASGISRSRLRALLAFENRVWDDMQPTCVLLLRREKTSTQLTPLYEQCLAEHPANAHILENNGALTDVVETACRFAVTDTPPNNRLTAQLSIPIEEDREPRQRNAKASQSTYVFKSLEPAKTTVVYETYWRFACERQRIFHRRVRGEPGPWTEDQIL